MRKLFLVLIAILLTCGVASAVSIPQSENASTGGPYVWTVPVHNNESSTTMDVGDVVCWDIDSSTGDDDNYVYICDSADTYIVAGVVYGNDISAGDNGTVAVHGVVSVDYATSGGTHGGAAGALVCNSSSGATAKNCQTDAAAFGIVTTAASSGVATVYLKGLR